MRARPAESPQKPADSQSSGEVRVRAPSRLHFGLLSFGGGGRQFGGVGVMIRQPGVRLRVAAAEAFEALGPHGDRVRQTARSWADHYQLPGLPPCVIEVTSAPPLHVGLGVGTQLGLAVAAGLSRVVLGRNPPATELAGSVGRGRRSAVGTHGFAAGGLIVDPGKTRDQLLAPLESRWPLPAAWRFVLVRPAEFRGLAGAAEQAAFDRLPAVPADVTEQLLEELYERMLPAVADADFEQFSESMYRFNWLAGNCFAGRQGGAYNGPLLERLVDRIRSCGIRGVGQSSWGPTLFVLLPSQEAAEWFRERVSELVEDVPLAAEIGEPDNDGARLSVSSPA